MVGLQAGALMLVGLVLGIGGAVVAVRLVSSMLYAVGAGDVPVFAGAAVTMIVVAMVGVSILARRAMRTDPLVALRAD
jgi:putative ABC transport system permease protein